LHPACLLDATHSDFRGLIDAPVPNLVRIPAEIELNGIIAQKFFNRFTLTLGKALQGVVRENYYGQTGVFIGYFFQGAV
jgi:hypothetical protein